ncbi:MAG: septum formation protein Maf [Anaerolineae bacterium]|nr:septum formation protein Maf [Anaerolineae bacterium]
MTRFPVILASGSPRRHDFVKSLGIVFHAHVADIDEQARMGELPEDLVVRLSREKALAVAALYPNAIVIGADTVVALDGRVLGKPAGHHEATAMLRRLRDRPHHVYSGITVCSPAHDIPLTSVSDSTVWMRPYSDAEIAAYVSSGDPLDKAGAYGIQNVAFRPVARWQGCYAGVMGLCLCDLVELLSRAGLALEIDAPTACIEITGVPCCGKVSNSAD